MFYSSKPVLFNQPPGILVCSALPPTPSRPPLLPPQHMVHPWRPIHSQLLPSCLASVGPPFSGALFFLAHLLNQKGAFKGTTESELWRDTVIYIVPYCSLPRVSRLQSPEAENQSFETSVVMMSSGESGPRITLRVALSKMCHLIEFDCKFFRLRFTRCPRVSVKIITVAVMQSY